MGVRDLGTIVKKYAPTAVTRYASLSAFKGCRFAIDANLLTTKFHFVKSSNTAPGAEEPDADPHRHVRSWYYFLRALEREDILPIVVFDGDTRVPEKERENARRRAARAEQRARGQAENTRGERLRELKDVWSGVARDDRQLVARALKQVEAGPKRLDDIAPDSTPEPVLSDQTGDDLPPARVLPSDEPEPVIDIVPTTESEPVIENEASSIAAPRLEPEVITVDQPEPAIDVVKPSPVTTGEQQSGLSVDERLKPQVDSLKTLYASFRQDETNPVYSRNQAIVTIEEKSFYSFILAQEKGDDSDIIDDGEELAQVIAKSDKLGSSHRSRAMGVPSSAFQDTMRLIMALGVPFVKPSPDEPHEAEGLCSTLYHLGLVDYVVSEDTDVAVYGAPLLRKISTVRTTKTSTGTPDEDSAPAVEEEKQKEGMNVLDPVKLREALNMNQEQFVDFALLCGTDFTERIPFLGPARALEYIRNVGLIPDILTSQTRYKPTGDPESYLSSIHAARAIFLTPPPIPSDAVLTPREPEPGFEDLLAEFGIIVRRGQQVDDEDGSGAHPRAVPLDALAFVDAAGEEEASALSSDDDDDQAFYDALEEFEQSEHEDEDERDLWGDEWDDELLKAMNREVDRLAELHFDVK